MVETKNKKEIHFTVSKSKQLKCIKFSKSILTTTFIYASYTRLYVTFSSFNRLYVFSFSLSPSFVFILSNRKKNFFMLLSNVYTKLLRNYYSQKISPQLTESIHSFESRAVHNRSSSIHIHTHIHRASKTKKKRKREREREREKETYTPRLKKKNMDVLFYTSVHIL